VLNSGRTFEDRLPDLGFRPRARHGGVVMKAAHIGIAFVGVLTLCLAASAAVAQSLEAVTIRGKPQMVHVYGVRGRPPVVVSSGDGGWMHLGPHVAEVLAAHGYFVVGFDVKAYLSSFTAGKVTLKPEDEPGDYRILAKLAAQGTNQRPVLVGVSEGAGLSVLAAAADATKAVISGVIGLGLPDKNELGWRWTDTSIYFTHASPNEPMFSSAKVIDHVSPLPMAAIHSTQDEFVPLDEIRRVMAAARDPKQLWIVKASNHRFSDNLAEFDRRLLEAMAWIAKAGR
jgi:type IV secretory pathway VirJ component